MKTTQQHVRLAPTLLFLCGVAFCLTACAGPSRYRETYPDARTKAIGEQDGEAAVGTWIRYYPDGSLASLGDYVEGRQQGRWVYGHPGGEPAGVGYFHDGIQHGWWSVTDEQGWLQSAGMMGQGLRVGPWVERINGRLARTDYGIPNSVSGSLVAASTDTTIVWRLSNAPADRAVVIVEATWNGPGTPTREFFLDPEVIALFSPQPTPPSTAEAIAPVATVPLSTAAPLDGSLSSTPVATPAVAVTPAVDPAPAASERMAAVVIPGVALSPIPQQDQVAGIDRWFGSYLVSGFLAGETATPNNAKQLAIAAPVGDPVGLPLVGKALPQTRFLTISGGVIDLAHPVRPTALFIMRGFSNSICLHCSSQTAAILKSQKAFTDAGIDVLILYPGSAESVPVFLASAHQLAKDGNEKAFPVPVLLDINLMLVRALSIEDNLSKPTTLILGRDGLVAWAYVGRSISDRPTMNEVLAVALTHR